MTTRRTIRDRRHPNEPVLTIALPNSRRVTIGEYVRSWRQLKTLPPGKSVAGFNYFPASAHTILRELSFGVQDRINIRGGIKLPQPSPARAQANEKRIQAALRRTVKCECSWCGNAMPYAPKHSRLCSASCAMSYRN